MMRLLRLPGWLVPGLFITIALVVTARLMLPLVGSHSPDALRKVRIEEQQWHKRVRRLQQWQADAVGSEARQSGTRTLDELRLTLLESLERATELAGLSIDDVSIEQASRPGLQVGQGNEVVSLAGSESSIEGVTTLRLTLDGVVPHAGHLLAVFEHLANAIDSYPAEVRGCSLQRMKVERGIRARCLYDIYHWEEPSLPDDQKVRP